MNKSLIHLSKNYSIEARMYAIMKTAIIGLPNSGKSHTALVIAEELLENKIPIVAFDPAGIWWSLKTGVNGNKGYQVVVAGGENADIPLTKHNARNIIDAAMKENISIIFDLAGEETAHKADWRSIVKDTVNHLYFHNKQYGIRHIFLEECAEFVPQRIIDFEVYSVLDKTIRIGRNKGLGITLINQRAAAINKEAYENCNLNILHNQEGKNSLKQIQDWFTIKRESANKEIMQSIPNLHPGECWIIGNRMEPVKVQVRSRKTFHPDPYQQFDNIPFKHTIADVRIFVNKLQQQLSKVETKPKEKLHQDLSAITELQNKLESSEQIIRSQAEKLQQKELELETYKLKYNNALDVLEGIRNDIDIFSDGQNNQPEFKNNDYAKQARHLTPPSTVPKNDVPAPVNDKKSSGKIQMLRALFTFQYEGLTKQAMGIVACMSARGGTFQEYYRQLKREQFIEERNGNAFITSKGIVTLTTNGAANPLPAQSEYLLTEWADIEGGKKKNMLHTLYRYYPSYVDKETFASKSEMSGSGGTFNEYERQLRRKGLIIKANGKWKLADEFFINQNK